MIRRQPSLITIATEETISFLMLSADGRFQSPASLSLADFLEESTRPVSLPKTALQSVNRLLVVPDYWMGNRFHEFQARKKSVITAFIERKLKLEQPALTEAVDFYHYTVVQDQDHRQQLYTFFLQEEIAYRLYRRLEKLGISPLRITTPAQVWQARLDDRVDGFAGKGIGFVHLDESDCFLYFFFMGQFLFSRHIQIPDTDGDVSQVYNLLNYEINQSFYLYSQKTKSAVDSLYMLAPDPSAVDQLTGLLGREVRGLAALPSETAIPEGSVALPSCRAFTALDLTRRGEHYLSYRPLKNERVWRPVQWAGIAVGLVLAVLLTVESGVLYLWSRSVDRQMLELTSTAADPPEIALQDLSQALDDITRELMRPSGGGTLMRTLLAMPDGVSVRKISLDVSGTPVLKVEALVDADNPDAFKAVLAVFLNQLNQRFNLESNALREKDVSIHLDRSQGDGRKPVYQINFGFAIS